jgi:hypothetical protein
MTVQRANLSMLNSSTNLRALLWVRNDRRGASLRSRPDIRVLLRALI